MPQPSARRKHHRFRDFPVILVRPCYPENIGSVCRVMQTMGFHTLRLVNPEPLASPSHPNAVRMAVGSLAILKETRIFTSLQEAVADCSAVYAATARGKRGPVLTPRQTAAELLKTEGKMVALVFGSESNGLTRMELAHADRLIRIPMAGSQPSLNLSHAVMIVLYELLSTLLVSENQTASPIK